MSACGTYETFAGAADASGLLSKAELSVVLHKHVLRIGGRGYNRILGNNPMQLPKHDSPKCGARTRCGTPCQSRAMLNGRCRMHGGKSPGAPKGNRNAWKHGHYTAEVIVMRKLVRQLLTDARDTVERF